MENIKGYSIKGYYIGNFTNKVEISGIIESKPYISTYGNREVAYIYLTQYNYLKDKESETGEKTYFKNYKITVNGKANIDKVKKMKSQSFVAVVGQLMYNKYGMYVHGTVFEELHNFPDLPFIEVKKVNGEKNG